MSRPRAPRWLIAAALVLATLVLAALVARSRARRYLESADFRSTVEETVAMLVPGDGVSLRAPRSRAEGIGGVRLAELTVLRADRPVLSLNVATHLRLFPEIFTGNTGLAIEATIAGGGSLTANGTLSIGELIDLLDGALPQGARFHAELRDLDAAALTALWPPLGGNDRMALLGGRVSATLARTASDGATHVTLTVGRSKWRVPGFPRGGLELPPWNAELVATATTISFTKPVRLRTPLSPVELSGAIQRASADNPEAALDLAVDSSGGPLGRLALARLLRCRNLPPQDRFKVKGPMTRPQCR